MVRRLSFVLVALVAALSQPALGDTLSDAETFWDTPGSLTPSGPGTSCGFPGSPCPFDTVALSPGQTPVAYQFNNGALVDPENFELEQTCGAVRIRAVVSSGDGLVFRECNNSGSGAASCDTSPGSAGTALLTINASGDYGPYLTWPKFVILDRTAVAGSGSRFTMACYEHPPVTELFRSGAPGVVPATGTPTGKCLLDTGVWGACGEANTASNLGGGLANFDSKLGVDLRFNTFGPADFDLAANLISLDTTVARRNAANSFGTNIQTITRLQLPEQSAPGSAPANTLEVYATDANGFTVFEGIGPAGLTRRFARDNYFICKLAEAASVGDILYVSGATGANERCSKWIADGSVSRDNAGSTLDAGATNDFVRVMFAGKIDGLNTSAFTEGNRVWASAVTPGAITATEPLFPNLQAPIGTVTRAHATQGEILIEPLVVLGRQKGTRNATFTIGPSATNNWVITPGTTAARTITGPDANAVVVQPVTCAGTDKLNAISASGVPSCGTDQTGGGGGAGYADIVAAVMAGF